MMSRRVCSVVFALSVMAAPRVARAQDTTFRGITISGTYDPRRDKAGIVVLPVAGAFGDSIRAIIQRDLDWSDRFNVIPVEQADSEGVRQPGTGTARGLNYSLFAKLGAVAVAQVTAVPSGLHVSLHDVARAAVINVDEIALPSVALGRDWRLAVHRASDQIERWVTGQPGISATRIAYIRGNSIRIIDSDGFGEITVPTEENGYSPSWHPSGNMLVYSTFGVAGRSGSRILLIDLLTGRSRTLVPATRNTTMLTPVFTPDGKSVVFSRAGEGGSDLFSIGIDGTDSPRRMTASRGFENTNPAISPDGRRVAYTTDILGRQELYIMDADGTHADVLTNYDFSEKNYRAEPDWAPDNSLIAYQERINGRFQLRTIPVRGGTPKLLTSDGENEQPSWAPDSRHLVFTSNRSGVRQIWVMDVQSGRIRQLTKSAGSRLSAWSPRLVGP
jgi:TolB protein